MSKKGLGSRGIANDPVQDQSVTEAGHLNYSARVPPSTKWECSAQCLRRQPMLAGHWGGFCLAGLAVKGHNPALISRLRNAVHSFIHSFTPSGIYARHYSRLLGYIS